MIIAIGIIIIYPSGNSITFQTPTCPGGQAVVEAARTEEVDVLWDAVVT